MNIKNTLLAVALITFSSASIACDDLIGYSDTNRDIAAQLAEQNYQLQLESIAR